MKDGSSGRVLDWNVTGASICYLAAEVLLLVKKDGTEFACIISF